MSDVKNTNQNVASSAFDFEEAQILEVSQVFFRESAAILEELDACILRLEKQPNDEVLLNQLFRKVHTLKGSVGAIPGGQLFGSLAHEMESILSQLKKTHQTPSKNSIDLFLHSSKLLRILAENLRSHRELMPEELSEVIEVISHYSRLQIFSNESIESHKPSAVSSIEKSEVKPGIWLEQTQVDEFIKMSGELVVLKNTFQLMLQSQGSAVNSDLAKRRQSEFAQDLNSISDLFQEKLRFVQKEKVAVCLEGLGAIVRQAGTELNKKVQYTELGFDLRIDKGLGHDLKSALVHILRNSMDHGIETLTQRISKRKPDFGQITVQVYEENDCIFCEVKDDGHGLDSARILEKAIANGLVKNEQIEKLSEQEIFQFIFLPGFSTREKITTTSGRGVGMDVVRNIADKYHGQIQIQSTLGQGTAFKLIFPIPKNVTVEKSLLCRWGKFYFSIPLGAVLQMVSCDSLRVTNIKDVRYTQHNQETIPLLDFAEIQRGRVLLSEEQIRKMQVVVLRSLKGSLALLVDAVEQQMDLVLKPLSPIIGDMQGVKGTSILPDERITYLIDVESLMQLLAPQIRRSA